MTAGEWPGDRDGVLERDDHTCRRCGTTDDEDAAGLRCYPVGPDPREGPVHESAVVTVCSRCFASLRAAPDAERRPDALFDSVRTVTEREGVTVSAVAAFASLTTGLPAALADGNGTEDESTATDTDPDATASEDPDATDVSETAAEYRQARREVLLAVESVDADLEHLHAVDQESLEPSVAEAVGAFTGTTTKLQSELRGIVALGETVVAGLDRCQGCFEPLPDGGRCATCGIERRDVGDWRPAPDADVAFGRLYEAINETLQTASGTTEDLTERTTAVAERLRGD